MTEVDDRPVQTDASIFVHIPDSNEQQATTSENSGDSETTNFNELLSNYTDETTLSSPSYSGSYKPFDTKCTVKFPAFKWECTLPDNIVDQQQSGRSTNPINNRSIFQQSPAYSQWSSSNSSPLSAHRNNLNSLRSSNSVSLADNGSLSEIATDLEPQECLKLVEICHELIKNSQLKLETQRDQMQFDYTSLDGTIVKLRTRDLTRENNPNPLFCRTKTQSVHILLRIREQVIGELSKLLNESIEKENFGLWQRHEHKLSKRLSNSIRRARRLSSYGYKREIFGRSLISIRSHSTQNSPFPQFIHQALAILLYEAQKHQTEGLMRTAASKAKLDVSYKLCNMLDVNDMLPAELCTAFNVFIIADLFKRFLRETPESLLPSHVWQLMVQCYKLEGPDRLLGLQYCVLLLNSSQREAFFIVAIFLLKLSRFKQNTLMDLPSLVTVIMPNITEMESIDPLEQSNKCKGLTATLTFVIEHIYDIMCMPTKLLLDSSEKYIYQIALNTIAFNVSYCHLQNSYWQNEQAATEDILVKSRVDYKDLNKESVEFRAEIQLETCGSAVFASLVDSNRCWDSTFSTYERHGFDETEEIVECRFGFATDQLVYLKRYSGRIYDENQSQIYVLFEKSIQHTDEVALVECSQTFLIQPIDVYNTKIIFLSSITTKDQTKVFGATETAQILSAFKNYYQSENNDLNEKQRPLT